MKISVQAVYAIVNTVTNKRYIGSTVNLDKRVSAHRRLLLTNQHHCPELQSDFNKYGASSFEVVVIEFGTKERLREREQHWIDNTPDRYNVSLCALTPMGKRKHSTETLLKFRGRPVRKGKDNHSFGKKWTPEVRAKILSARIGSKHTSTTRDKMSATALKNGNWTQLLKYTEAKQRQVVDSNGNLFESLSSAAKFWGISIQAICDNLKGRSKKTRPGITFKYLEGNNEPSV